jgi:hypothetical protein
VKAKRSLGTRTTPYFFGGVWEGGINLSESSRISPVRPSIKISAGQVSMEKKTAGIFSLFYEVSAKLAAASVE